MKKLTNTIQLIILILVIVLTTTISASAIKVYQGYVILNDDSQLEGKIQMLSPTLNEVKVRFTSKDNKRNIFKAKEVKEYGFKVEKWNNKTRQHDINSIIYVRQTVERSPIAFGPIKVLIERQISGSISMFNHFVEQNSNVKNPFVHILYVQKGEKGNLVNLTKKNYRTILKEMTAEYPELQAKVGSRGYGFKYIDQIITTYNNWMLENGEEVVLGMG